MLQIKIAWELSYARRCGFSAETLLYVIQLLRGVEDTRDEYICGNPGESGIGKRCAQFADGEGVDGAAAESSGI
ncbi:hypothetical protein [Pseudomonas sp. S31]|uniref:hypothetical protein n=1 Tax=Pseudomonas sp. S31 TaxID=1564473 RepID=UPI001F1D6D9B|nr:hypothetical protein [Pseudomonas sp. S31]